MKLDESLRCFQEGSWINGAKHLESKTLVRLKRNVSEVQGT